MQRLQIRKSKRDTSKLLDIVQSFPLLSYCIVSLIYISPICNVDFKIHYSGEIIKLGILYFFSLHMVSEPREKT